MTYSSLYQVKDSEYALIRQARPPQDDAMRPKIKRRTVCIQLYQSDDDKQLNWTMRSLCNNRSGALQDSGAIRVTLQKRPNGDEDLMVRGHCVMLVDCVS